MKQIAMLLFAILLAAPSLPASGGDFGSLASAELKALIDRNEPGLVLIDSRSQGQFDEGHLKGALNIPLEEMERNPDLPRVPKGVRLVFYCSGNT